MYIIPCLRFVALSAVALAPVLGSAQTRRSVFSRPALTGIVLTPGGPPVSGIRAQAAGPNIMLRWNCPPGATGFEVFGGLAGGNQSKLTAAPISPNCVQDRAGTSPSLYTKQPGPTPQATYSTGYSHVGLPLATDFTYVVRTLYPSGGPADSDPVTARAGLYPAPTGVSASESGLAGIAVTWNAVNSGYGFLLDYVISRKLAGEVAFRDIATWNLGPSLLRKVFNDTGISPGLHQYRVRAVDGEWSAPLTIAAGVPTVTPGIRLTSPQVVLGWNTLWPGGVARVTASATASGPFTDVSVTGHLGATSWTGTNVQPGATVYFKVIAVYPKVTMESPVVVVSVPVPPVIAGFVASYQPDLVFLFWPCDSQTDRYGIIRGPVGRPGDFLRFADGNTVIVYPTDGKCGYRDAIPKGTGPVVLEYRLIGSDVWDRPIKESRTTVSVP